MCWSWLSFAAGFLTLAGWLMLGVFVACWITGARGRDTAQTVLFEVKR